MEYHDELALLARPRGFMSIQKANQLEAQRQNINILNENGGLLFDTKKTELDEDQKLQV